MEDKTFWTHEQKGSSHKTFSTTTFPQCPSLEKRPQLERWVSLRVDLGMSHTGLALNKGYSICPLNCNVLYFSLDTFVFIKDSETKKWTNFFFFF